VAHDEWRVRRAARQRSYHRITRPASRATLSLLLLGCASTGGRVPVGTTVAAITEQDLEHRLRIIADDSMMGRESGSEGDFKTAEYIASEFRRLGLDPAGENGTYFQTVPFWTSAADPSSRLDVGGTALQFGRDFLPASLTAPRRVLENVEAVYGGSLADPGSLIGAEQATDRFVVLSVPPGAPMRGLRIDPRFHYAKAIGITLLDDLPPEMLARLRVGRPVADTSTNPEQVPVLWISRPAAATLLGASTGSLSPGAQGRHVNGSVGFAHAPVPFPARNVVAILRGRDPALRGEYLSLTAHNDHVGFDHSPVDHDSLRAFNEVIRPMGADSPLREPTDAEWTRIRSILDSLRRVRPPRLDSIRNGADDDGSGTVSILEIAEAMARGPVRPRRSILFVSHTGEEAGLLGSRWFTDHPTVPLDSVIGEIDQDMVGRGKTTDFPRNGTGAGGPTYLEVVGAKRLSQAFGNALDSANAHQPLPFVFNLEYDQPGHPLQYYCRADHFSYARYGIPAVALSRGEHLDYHQVTDEAQYIDYTDLARVSRMVYDMAMALANAPARPALDVPKPADPHGPCRQ
jgi:peptidase M28-like protein